MFLKNIKIRNFRNISNCDIDPETKINFIYGKNAQGKTNLLESIYFSSIYKSFRTNKNIDLIKKNKDEFIIDLQINNNLTNNNLKIIFDKKNNKKIFINNKKPEKTNFYKIINSITYYPDEIIYLKTYPSYRRSLIDRSIFFIKNEYSILYNKYIKCLKQRNLLIRNKSKEYDTWKDKLIEYGYLIINERIKYIERINDQFNSLCDKNEINEKYFIDYSIYNKENIKEDLNNKFINNSIKEIKYGYTLVGPHTDNIIFEINDNNINKYSSEGQKRSFLLTYKQSQLLDYYNYYGYYPILLFDDMENELDKVRRTNIFNKILDKSGQIFITTTDLPVYKYENSKYFEVINGEINEIICN